MSISIVSYSQNSEVFIVAESGGHTGRINAMAVGPSGEELVSVSDDKTIRVWDIINGRLLRTIRGQIGDGSQGRLLDAAMHPRSIVAVGGITGSPGNRTLRMVNIFSGEVQRIFSGIKGDILSVAISRNGKIIAVGSSDQTVTVFNYDNDDRFILPGHNGPVQSLSFSPDNKLLVSGDDTGRLIIWDMLNINGSPTDYQKIIKAHNGKINVVRFAPKGGYFLSGGVDNLVKGWDSNGNSVGTLVSLNDPMNENEELLGDIEAIDISPDGTKAIIGTSLRSGENAQIYDIRNGKKISSVSITAGAITSVLFLDNENVVSAGGEDREIMTWKVRDGSIKHRMKSHGKPIHTLSTGSSSQVALSQSSQSIQAEKIFDYSILELDNVEDALDLQGPLLENNGVSINVKGRNVELSNGNTIQAESKVLSVSFTPTGHIAVGTTKCIEIFDKTGARLNKTLDQAVEVLSLVPSKDGQYLISGGSDQLIRFWNMKDISSANSLVNPIAKLFVSARNGWVLWTPSRNYISSQTGGGYAGFHINKGEGKQAEFKTLEQFELFYNRPDEVLGLMESQNQDLISSYHAAWTKKVTKHELSPLDLQKSLSAPRVQLTAPPSKVTMESLTLNFKVVPGEADVESIHVLVNDVALHGWHGFPAVIGSKSNSVTVNSTSLILNPGKNKVQVYLEDKNGAKSNRETIYVSYEPIESIRKPDLYFYSLGVSEYRDTEMDLKYIPKDARELTGLFDRMKHLYNKVNFSVMTNENISFKKIADIRSRLEKTEAKDIVIIYVGGHALIDKELDYYLGTYTMDFTDPKRGGFLFEYIEDVLDGIPARHKLVFVDASHPLSNASGAKSLIESVEEGDLYSEPFGQGSITDAGLSLENAAEVLKRHFAELSMNTGAMVISTTSGSDFYVEGAGYQNGLFTYTVKQGLATRKADLNGDGKIMVSELREYLYKMNSTLTMGLVIPTTREEVLENDFVIWK